MRTLVLVLMLTGTAHAADIYDDRANRIGRTEERQERIEVFDPRSNRLGEGVRHPDGSLEFRDPQGNRIGQTSTPRGDDSVIFEDAQSKRLGQGRPDPTGRYHHQDRTSTRRGSGDASGPVWPQGSPRR